MTLPYGSLGINADGGTANPLYGWEKQPAELGSGGASLGGYVAGNGGGRIDIQAGNVVVNGQLLADGGTADGYAGGGSGGAIFIRVTGGSVSGSGTIRAAGGGSTSGSYPGGLGRIAIVGYSANTFAGTLGRAGTIFLQAAGTGGDLILDSTTLTVASNTTNTYGSILAIGPASTILNYGTLAFTTDALTLTNLTLVQQGVIKGADRTENIIGSMLVQPNAVLTHLRGNTNGLRIRVAGLLEVQSGAAMDVSGKGYRGGFRDGNTSGTAEPNSAGTFSTGRSGGSYGTLGTSDNGSANPLYGVESAPVELGSGGASTSGSYLGGNGGGRIDIEAGALRLDGRLVANGGDSSGYAGAGSGGAIFIRIAGGAFFGQGFIGAAGGASYFPGGGGRIAMVGFSLNSFTGTLGGQGTLYLHAGGSLPQITQQPAGQTAISGETVVFSVEARGDGPLSYQWRKNAGDLAAQTNATLTLTNVQIADAGDYAVLVSNAAGAVLSASARLEVNPPNLRAALWEHTSSGDFKIHFEGTPGRRWVIECSSDLKRWGPLWTNTPAAALWEFTDTATSPEPARFYRAVLQP